MQPHCYPPAYILPQTNKFSKPLSNSQINIMCLKSPKKMLIYIYDMKGIYEIIMCKDQKHDEPCNFKLEDNDVEQF